MTIAVGARRGVVAAPIIPPQTVRLNKWKAFKKNTISVIQYRLPSSSTTDVPHAPPHVHVSHTQEQAGHVCARGRAARRSRAKAGRSCMCMRTRCTSVTRRSRPAMRVRAGALHVSHACHERQFARKFNN